MAFELTIVGAMKGAETIVTVELDPSGAEANLWRAGASTSFVWRGRRSPIDEWLNERQ